MSNAGAFGGLLVVAFTRSADAGVRVEAAGASLAMRTCYPTSDLAHQCRGMGQEGTRSTANAPAQ
jgi:hypothetical protein